MVSAFSPNIQLEEPARGDQVGTWDTPVNNNMTLIDKVVGAITTISLNNSNVVLSSPQYQSKTIIFNSTLTGSVSITFPSTFTKSYEIQNLCTGTSAFTITLQTTVAGGQAIGTKPGEFFSIVSDGTNLKFKNLGNIGTYWDYAGSSVPSWVSGCTVPPYLNCDGTTFSAGTYPALAIILGSTTLPDSKGRVRATLNQGTTRLTSAAGGLNGGTAYAGGGADSITLLSSQLPANIPNSAAVTGGIIAGTTSIANAQVGGGLTIPTGNSSIVVTVTINPSGGVAHSNIQPTYIGGLTLIRSA